MSFATALTWSNLDAKSQAIYIVFKVPHDVHEPRRPSSLGVIDHGQICMIHARRFPANAVCWQRRSNLALLHTYVHNFQVSPY
ncbi:hypothetical protein GGS26DRAFT_579067 [Hypomontagnella submonticulosa]|nr:hypothetical protein GGS26DRAFT_579067 [Hypomontagnella submonticulosa]